MNSLRSKLALGFGGLLVILLLVSALTVVVLTRYSHTLETVFSENYDSAIYCDGMKSALRTLDARAEQRVWHDEGLQPDVADAEAKFAANLQNQLDNCTLPGERELTNVLAKSWSEYKDHYDNFNKVDGDRAALYRDDLFPRAERLAQFAQRLLDMNMSNMISVDGRARRTLVQVRDLLLILVFAGALLATIVFAAVGASILKPLSALTRSARQIEKGNLDLSVQVRSNDEIGQLAEAFNSMASRLREFRTLDHDRLQRSQQTTQLAIDSLPDAVFVIGPAGKVEISNRTAHTHFGIDPGTDVQSLHLKWLDDMVASVLAEQKPAEPNGYKSALQLFENGIERFLLPRAMPMVNLEGKRIGVTVILADVTRLRAADEIKSGLVSTVSHELRTPLTSLRMSVNLLDDARLGTLSSRQKDLVGAAREEVDRLYRTIENLLNYSRIESGRAQFQLQAMSPSQLIGPALDAIRVSFEQKGIALRSDVGADLPAVIADPSTIHYVLGNLLSNALKFTPAGGSVTVSATATRDAVDFFVADTGPGIPAEYAQRIFEKFFRVPSHDGPTGAGLGLAIAKDIVEAHGGQIDYSPNPGGGSLFRVSLRSARSAAVTPG